MVKKLPKKEERKIKEINIKGIFKKKRRLCLKNKYKNSEQ